MHAFARHAFQNTVSDFDLTSIYVGIREKIVSNVTRYQIDNETVALIHFHSRHYGT